MIMPYTWLVRIGLFSSFREADRFTELGLLAAALLAAAAVNWLRYHAQRRWSSCWRLASWKPGSVGAGASPGRHRDHPRWPCRR